MVVETSIPAETGPIDAFQAGAVIASILEPDAPEDEKPAKAAKAEPEPVAEEADDTPAEASEEDAEPEDAEPEAVETVTIKIDGKDVEVPLDELKKGYQRHADYTRKTMEVAETRKAAEAQAQQAQQERITYAQNLQRMQAQLEGALQEQKETDWQALLNSDPVEYLRQQHQAQARQAALQENLAEQQKLAAYFQAEQAEAQKRHLEQQQEALLAKLPEWKDEAKAKADKSALRDYLLEQGFAAAEVSNVADARAVVMARKAMLYDKMIEKAKAATKKVATLPAKVERPGVGESQRLDKRSSAFQRLARSGSVEDAASVIAGLID